jgi:hypothetical protein
MSLTCWPPRSPDLTTCDFFMGICQRQCLRPFQSCYDDLKQRITTATAGVDEDMLTRVWKEFDCRVDI